MIHTLTSKDYKAFWGFRIEVTFKAPSLQEAHGLVRVMGFLSSGYWPSLGYEPHPPITLTAQVILRDGLLANANWVLNKPFKPTSFEAEVATVLPKH